MNNESFDLLKMDFPISEIRNTKPYPMQLPLTGDSVQVQGNATARIASNMLYQIPDLSTFKLISPSMEDYIKYGVIGGKEDEEEAKDSPDTPAAKVMPSNSTEQKDKPEEIPTASAGLTGANIKTPVTNPNSTPSAKPSKSVNNT